MPALTSETRLRLALAAGAFALAYALSALRIGHGAPDFYVFWTAARHWQAPYDPAIVAQLLQGLHLKGVWPFAYPADVPPFRLAVRASRRSASPTRSGPASRARSSSSPRRTW